MKKILLIFFLIHEAFILRAQNVTFVWAKQMGGTGANANGFSVTTDAVGNVYTSGVFDGTVDFDPGAGVFNLSAIGSLDQYVSKLDSNGNLLWAKQIGGTDGEVVPWSITLDTAGNIYTTGYFNDTMDFDPGPGIFNLNIFNSNFLPEPFILKLDNAGNFIWAKQFGGTGGSGWACSITIDAAGNVVTTGLFSGTVDFDPGPGIFNLGTVSIGDQAIFISKLSAAGNFIWAKQIGGNTSGCVGESVVSDAAGNVYTTGHYSGTIDFDPGPGVYNLTTVNGAIFVSKLDAAGNFIFAKQMGGWEGNSITLDVAGNICTTGSFYGTVDFDPGPAVFNLSSVGNDDIFVSKLDAFGNFVWAKQIGGTGHDEAFSIDTDVFGNIYTTGLFFDTADFDPGTGIFNLNSFGENDIFVSKLDASGNFVWAKQMGGTGFDCAFSIAVDALGNIYTTGYFDSSADFDPGTATYNLTSFGASDIFVHKMSRCTNATSSTITASACSTYTLNGQTYTTSGVYTQTLINAAGCDSIITLNLTINNSINTTINAAACNSYFWNGQTYTSSGIYKDTIALPNGCDSIITLNLVINSRSFSVISAAICSGQVYAGHTTAGTYIDTLIAANGCDSIHTLTLTVKPGSFATIDTEICSGQNYGGHTLAGTYTDVLIAANGCDSVRTVNLTVKNNCSIYIPNAFTPNNDGLNDLFKPTINLPLQKFGFIIFNRYGEKIFETYEYGRGWDGTYKGKKQSTGSYVYRITFINTSGIESEYNGSVLLIR